MLALWMLACGTAPVQRPFVGCWESVEQKRLECFRPDGIYEINSQAVGSHDGVWRLEDGALTVTVEPFPSDRYSFRMDGDELILSRPERADRRYRRLRGE